MMEIDWDKIDWKNPRIRFNISDKTPVKEILKMDLEGMANCIAVSFVNNGRECVGTWLKSYFEPIREAQEIRPRPGEVWLLKGSETTHCDGIWFVHGYKQPFFPLRITSDKGALVTLRPNNMIHGKYGWRLVWSPDPERMKLIGEEQK